jgi:hypothetical protein
VRATALSHPQTFRVSSTLLGRVKLQASTTNPTKPPPVPSPLRVLKPRKPHRASIADH